MSTYTSILNWWQSHQLRCPCDLDRLLQRFNPRFVRESCLLEGWDIPLDTAEEVFRSGTVSQFSGDPKALLQLYTQKQCYEYLREKIMARDDMDTFLVLEIHRILTSGTYAEPYYLASGERAGEFKKQDYVTAVNAVGVPARDVGKELDQLMEEVSGYCGSDLLRAAAYLHARFENIHPFAAGNGATGRVLVNFFLLTRDHPPLLVFSQDQDRYYACLTTFDQQKDARPLADFFQEQLEKFWKQ